MSIILLTKSQSITLLAPCSYLSSSFTSAILHLCYRYSSPYSGIFLVNSHHSGPKEGFVTTKVAVIYTPICRKTQVIPAVYLNFSLQYPCILGAVKHQMIVAGFGRFGGTPILTLPTACGASPTPGQQTGRTRSLGLTAAGRGWDTELDTPTFTPVPHPSPPSEGRWRTNSYIGVGVGVGVSIIVLFGFWAFRRWTRPDRQRVLLAARPAPLWAGDLVVPLAPSGVHTRAYA